MVMFLEMGQVAEVYQGKMVLSQGGVSVKVRHSEDALSVENGEEEWNGQGYP